MRSEINKLNFGIVGVPFLASPRMKLSGRNSAANAAVAAAILGVHEIKMTKLAGWRIV